MTPDRLGNSTAVLIGTSDYQDAAFLPVPAAANSLAEMRRVLADPGLCGWPERSITVLENPAGASRLVRTLRRLAAGTDQVLLLYFVGHGVMNVGGRLCLVLADTDAEHPDITGVDYAHVREALLGSPAHTKIVILDCCYSGRAVEALSGALADDTATTGVYTLTASDRAAHVPPFARQANSTTSFTGELVDLIRTGIPGGPEQLTLGLLYPHLRRRMRLRGLPTPNRRVIDLADRFPFTRNAAAEPDSGTSDASKPPDPSREPAEPPALGGTAETDPAPLPRGRPPLDRRKVLLGGLAAAATAGGAWLADRARDALWPPDLSVARLRGHSQPVVRLVFSPDGRTLASQDAPDGRERGGGGEIFLWDTVSRKRTAALGPSGYDVCAMIFSRDGRTLTGVVGTWESAPSFIRSWDVRSGKQTSRRGGHLYPADFSRDGQTVAGYGKVGEDERGDSTFGAVLEESATRDRVSAWEIRLSPLNRAGEIRLSPDGRTLALIGPGPRESERAEVDLWDVTARKKIATLPTRVGTLLLAFSPDGRILATGDDGYGVQLWDTASRRRLAALGDRVLSLAFSPDGRTLATGHAGRGLDGGDAPAGAVRLWDVDSRHLKATLTGHDDGVRALAFTHDGQTLATGAADRTIRLWRVP